VRRISVVGLCVLSILVGSGVARSGVGELVQVDMEGSVSQVPLDPSVEMQFMVGQPTFLTYVYDTAAPDGDESPTRGTYHAISSLSGSFGSYAFSSMGGSISVEVPSDSDRHVFQVSVQSIGGAEPIGDAVGVFELTGIFSNLEDSTETAFVDDSLPTDLDLMDFDVADVRLRFDDGNSAVFVRSNVTSLTVPEPGGSAGLLAATGALVLLRRRR